MQENKIIQAEQPSGISNCYEEDEIDLKELFQTVWRHRKFVLIFTLSLTFLAGIYAFLKTPLYEVKSNIQIGFIGKDLIAKPENIAKRLQLIFHTEENEFRSKELKKEGAYVESIKHDARKAKDFIQVVTYGIDNNTSLKKNKQVIAYLQKEYAPKIEQYIIDTQNKIEQLQIKKNNIFKIQIPNLQMKIKLLEKQKISQIENKIKFYKKYKLKDIDEKIAFYKEKLKEYNTAVKKLFEQFNRTDDTKVMIASIQMVNYQNLILDLQNKIKNLKLDKVKIINETIPQLQNEAERIRILEVKKIQDQIITTKNKIKQLDNQIKVLQFNISPANVQNFKVVGGYILKDNPAKPKRKLILIVAFITSLILSIFLVFFIEFIKGIKEEQ